MHRPGRRAVVHTAKGYLKVVRPGRAEAVAAGSRVGTRLADGAGLGSATVLATTGDTVRFAALPGIPVQRLSADPAWPAVWDAWADAWTTWQTLPAPDLPEHGPGHEAEVLRTWARRADAVGVLAGTPWADRLERTAAALETSPRMRTVPAHRDLHDGQVLWDGERLALIDLDTVCRAEPALDLANLEAHARLRRAQGLWSGRAARVVGQAVDRVAGAGGVEEDRMALMRRATLARLAAVYAFRPRWRETALAWADEEWCRGLGG
ncbi:hypothetical protein BJF80_16115 [Serinicoccus sp. CUA-874]|uniref:phosphotransferase n=1 Tax=Serinicoccus sp. CUA-874 TaxID=1517939 RepID=UPI000958EDAE|nr:hypothetical protein [Serinicoccus sp. CUA-874]OLT18271.1 hypothetical protein BJF80_16115 [Serinicoccus sp. CUA-874]